MFRSGLAKSAWVAIVLSGISAPPAGAIEMVQGSGPAADLNIGLFSKVGVYHRGTTAVGPRGGVYHQGGTWAGHGGYGYRGGYGYHSGYGYRPYGYGYGGYGYRPYGYGGAAALGAAALGAAAVGAAVAAVVGSINTAPRSAIRLSPASTPAPLPAIARRPSRLRKTAVGRRAAEARATATSF